MLFAGQLLIVPVARSTVTSAIAQNSRVHSNGSVENDNAKKANEVVENDGALPVQKRKSMPSVSVAKCVLYIHVHYVYAVVTS